MTVLPRRRRLRPPRRSESRTTVRQYWPLYLGALIYLCLRTPYEFLHGFVYDEEASVYLRYAWDARVWHALTGAAPGLLCSLPKCLWPDCCPGAAAGASRPFFVRRGDRSADAAGLHAGPVRELHGCGAESEWPWPLRLLTPPTASIAMSTIHAQFFMAVTTGVILISDAGRLRVSARMLTLVCAGLTGAASCALLPFFLLQTWKERTLARVRCRRGPAVVHDGAGGGGVDAAGRAGWRTALHAAVLGWRAALHWRTVALFYRLVLRGGMQARRWVRRKLQHWQDLWWLGT